MTAGLARFREEVEAHLPGLLEELVACPVHRRGVGAPAPADPGVYLYSEADVPRYVGRTRDLRARWGQHTRPSSGQQSAPLAFNIAKREAARDEVDVKLPRTVLAADPRFVEHFTRAKARVRAMDYRFVRIDDPNLSTVFEVYAAICLETEGDFNLFETH
ncbi:MAG: hypothetical protein JWQ20_1222 [Conexibacter sp.]|nr:hypothetical protein [Conexibacter sp.]